MAKTNFEDELKKKSFEEWAETPLDELPINPTKTESPYLMGRNGLLILGQQNAMSKDASGAFETSKAFSEISDEIRRLQRLNDILADELIFAFSPASPLHGSEVPITVSRFYVTDDPTITYGKKAPAFHGWTQNVKHSSFFKNVRNTSDVNREIRRLKGVLGPGGTPRYRKSLLAFEQKYPEFLEDGRLNTRAMRTSSPEAAKDSRTYDATYQTIALWETELNRLRDISGVIALVLSRNGVEGIYKEAQDTLTLHKSTLSPEKTLALSEGEGINLLFSKRSKMIDDGVSWKLNRGYALCSMPQEGGWYMGRRTQVPKIEIVSGRVKVSPDKSFYIKNLSMSEDISVEKGLEM